MATAISRMVSMSSTKAVRTDTAGIRGNRAVVAVEMS